MTRRVFLAAVGTAPLASAASWDEKAFADWSAATVNKLLTDSPWARQITVPFEYQPPAGRLRSDFSQIGIPGPIGIPRLPGGGPASRIPSTTRGRYPSVRTELYLTVRWSSALPVRQAWALDKWGRNGLTEPECVEFLGKEEAGYLIEVFGLPVIMFPQGVKRLEQDLSKNVRLWMRGKPPMRPASVHVPEYGEHLRAELRFPRSDGLNVDVGVIELHAETTQMKFEAKFKLKEMVYNGRLEL